MPGRGLTLHGGLTTPDQARRLLARLGLRLPGRVILRAEMPPGGGAGSSTAALVALARLAGFDGPPETLARACVAVEGATDPLMFPASERRLWASRIGETLAMLPELPRFEVLGGFFGPPQRTRPGDDGFPDISDLVADWPGTDLGSMTALVSDSAARTLRLRGDGDDPTARLARDTGALGWLIAHTGSARGLIFAPRSVPADAPARLRAAGLRGIVQFRAGGA